MPLASAIEYYAELCEDVAETIDRSYGTVKPHQFATPNKVIDRYPKDDPYMVLVKWEGPKSDKEKIAKVGAPTAGHDPTIIDFGNGRSMVQGFLDEGYTVVSAVTLPGRRGRGWSIGIDQLVDANEYFLDKVTNGGRRSIVTASACQKGWEDSIVNARNNDVIAASYYVGSPLRCKPNDGGDIERIANSIPFPFYVGMVATNGGIMPGELMYQGFRNINALKQVEQHIEGPVNIFKAIRERRDESKRAVAEKTLERSEDFESWWRTFYPINGKLYLEAVWYLFKNDYLYRGLLDVKGQRVNWADITRPTWIGWGTKEDITTFEQATGILHKISTPEEDKHIVLILEKGHIGSYNSKDSYDKTREVATGMAAHVGYTGYEPRAQQKKWYLGGYPDLGSLTKVTPIDKLSKQETAELAGVLSASGNPAYEAAAVVIKEELEGGKKPDENELVKAHIFDLRSANPWAAILSGAANLMDSWADIMNKAASELCEVKEV